VDASVVTVNFSLRKDSVESIPFTQAKACGYKDENLYGWTSIDWFGISPNISGK
jgi:hypothetical protein